MSTKMKKTKLSEVYCRPKKEDDWRLLGLKPHIYAEKSAVAWSNDMPSNNGIFGPTNPHLLKLQGRTEITVSKFLDLLEDRIVPWRLEEIGFEQTDNIYSLMVNEDWWKIEWYEHLGKEVLSLDDVWLNITTLTELEMLIKFLTPPKQ